ncbi:capsular polysaccharide synthesis protein [Eilatimonas milleporae]|uniref:Capsular polysaccharide synthesis protein n=1 Tax=Eilatimonas milleporae TaxID=911205 RepID=A0A3M0CSL6_9PROT|nr:capsular polysaccharide synthesis protein [Eilatimonas milleporae]RMB11927.1 capsular polysaccharide synthesis protein [Eilatimonas milleporae]
MTDTLTPSVAPDRPAPAQPLQPLPKTIWMLWFQGWDKAPEIAHACAATWVHHNPGWQIKLLSAKGLNKYAPDTVAFAKRHNISLTGLSNVVRMELLERFGGAWADATVYCTRPLDDWIDIGVREGFFAFNRPSIDRLIASWFLAVRPGSYMVRALRRQVAAYWQGRDTADEYHWFHRQFAVCHGNDPAFRTIWNKTPKFPAMHPHYLTPYDPKLVAPVTAADRQTVDSGKTFTLKLTHKLAPDLLADARARQNSVYTWLCDRTLDWPARRQLDASISRLSEVKI